MFNIRNIMIKKKELGQFFTTHHQYILNNLYIPDNTKVIIEPFCGNGDLIDFINLKYPQRKFIFECYDIDIRQKNIKKKDTLLHPPEYKDKFVITNPPYLARNKSKEKLIFEKYDVNDLYKCFIKEIINNSPDGGILIIPLNFWCSIRLNDITLRKLFLEKFEIEYLNIFEEQVFDDTSYTICSFQFKKKKITDNIIKCIHIFPSNKIIKNIKLYENNNFLIGGEIYHLPLENKYKITRLTSKNIDSKQYTNLIVKCIDDNISKQISLSYVYNSNEIYIDNTNNLSCRTFATLIIEPNISKNKQIELVEKFNNYIKRKREKYHSLFLTNYRESKDIARKRISFQLVYSIIQYILENWSNIENL